MSKIDKIEVRDSKGNYYRITSVTVPSSKPLVRRDIPNSIEITIEQMSRDEAFNDLLDDVASTIPGFAEIKWEE